MRDSDLLIEAFYRQVYKFSETPQISPMTFQSVSDFVCKEQ
jgi:hypothetical protein